MRFKSHAAAAGFAAAVTMSAVALCAASPASARDQLKIVGSSTVFPYSQAVAEEFGKKSGQRPPVVESTGTGGGMKIFCQGIGEGNPDVTGASRAMKHQERRHRHHRDSDRL
jgi:phosphate transport system substrate-binding protein